MRGHWDHVTAVVYGWSQLYLADLDWSTDALRHNSGLWPWGPIERWWYSETWPRAWALWTLDTILACTWKWAKWTIIQASCTPTGQYVRKVDKAFLAFGKNSYFQVSVLTFKFSEVKGYSAATGQSLSKNCPNRKYINLNLCPMQWHVLKKVCCQEFWYILSGLDIQSEQFENNDLGR